MEDYKNTMPENWRQKLFVGVEIPLPWLVGIVIALFFNAGVLYSQFDAIRKQNDEFVKFIKDFSTRTEQIERRVERMDDKNTLQDTQLLDHERRLRDVERLKK